MTSTKKKSVTKNQSREFPKDIVFASTKNAPLVQKRQQQIVEGACKILFEKGYHPTTTRDIAKACGMSMGQLYHYISSKDDVLYLVHKNMHKVWYDYLKNSEMEKIDDPSKKLSEALHHTLEFMVENKKLLQFVYTESKYLAKKHLKVVLEMDYKSVIGFWRNLLNEVNRRKSIKGDLDILASLIAFLLVFLPLQGWTLRGKGTKEILDSLHEFISRGLGVI